MQRYDRNLSGKSKGQIVPLNITLSMTFHHHNVLMRYFSYADNNDGT